MDTDYPRVGIDLGTTHSLIAVFRDGKPELIPNALGAYLTPSVVGVLPSGEVVVGSAARELRVTHPDRTASCFKRFMGQNRDVEVGGRKFSPPELSSLVLRSLREDAKAYLGCDVVKVVITVPAYFNDHARKATRLAGEMAGLQVLRMVNEPTAAALVYGFHEPDSEKNLCVIDLGGGTFDVTVMEVFEGTLEIRASAGESFLGGEDFTDRLVGHLLKKQNLSLELAELQHPTMVARLRSQCEAAKRRLTSEPSATIRMPKQDGTLPESGGEESINRDEFKQLCLPLLKRITMPISRAMRDAQMAAGDVNEVILVGGATRMGVLHDHVAQLFNKTPSMRFNPDEVVALGAAVQAALITGEDAVENMVMTDVCPFTLGVEIVKELGGQIRDGYFHPILHRNTTIPVSREEMFSTVTANQAEVVVRVFQGDGRRVEDNTPLGQVTVKGIPPGPAGTPVAIRFTYDISGVVEVEAYAIGGQKFRTVLASKTTGLGEREIEAARKRIAEMKFYPREDAETIQLIHYAQRLIGELNEYQRRQLDEALDGFEAAINRADRDAVEASRNYLRQVISSLGFDPDGLPAF